MYQVQFETMTGWETYEYAKNLIEARQLGKEARKFRLNARIVDKNEMIWSIDPMTDNF